MALEVPSCASRARIGSGPRQGGYVECVYCTWWLLWPVPPGPSASPSPWASPWRKKLLGCWPQSPLLKGFGRERDGEKEEEKKNLKRKEGEEMWGEMGEVVEKGRGKGGQEKGGWENGREWREGREGEK